MKHNLFEKCRNVEKKNCHPKIILPSFLKISCTKIFRREGEEVAMFFPECFVIITGCQDGFL